MQELVVPKSMPKIFPIEFKVELPPLAGCVPALGCFLKYITENGLQNNVLRDGAANCAIVAQYRPASAQFCHTLSHFLRAQPYRYSVFHYRETISL